jgi:flagellar hook-basal body complex protein FliE
VAIPPIGALPALPDLGAISGAGAQSAAGTGAATGAHVLGGADGSGFSNVLGNAIDSLNLSQTTASTDEVKAAAGQGTLANTMVAATEASLDTQVATSVIDKALAAYTSIANMSF